MSGWPLTKGWSPCLSSLTLQRRSTPSVTPCSCVDYLAVPSQPQSSPDSSLISLAGLSVCVCGPGGAFSPWAAVTAGVLQGSVLGPLLLAVYINDLKSSLKHCNHILYADDLQIYLHFSPCDLEVAVIRIKEDIAAIGHWASNNCLTLNARKMKAMLLGTAKQLNNIAATRNIQLTLNALPIELTSHAVNLVVHFTSTLSWSEHVKATSSRINGVLRQLKYHKNCLFTFLRTQLMSSLIFPYFDYCSVVLLTSLDSRNSS